MRPARKTRAKGPFLIQSKSPGSLADGHVMMNLPKGMSEVPIPESQFETWSKQGATNASQAAYRSVRDVLLDGKSLVKPYSPDVFLQGSYRNDTNIYADSDVDIVCRISETYLPDTSRLTATESSL
jgi:hypothetical protein